MVKQKTHRDIKVRLRGIGKESVSGITVTLPLEQIQYLRGKGNASEEVRKAVNDHMASESDEALKKLEDDEVLVDWKIHVLEDDIKNLNSDWKWVGDKRDNVLRELRAEHKVLMQRLMMIRNNKSSKKERKQDVK
jgi:hypothetical protein